MPRLEHLIAAVSADKFIGAEIAKQISLHLTLLND
jgi:hypothetical protein